MKNPNFFIVGAPKCGTTALSTYLENHPNIFMSRPKEPHFFADDFTAHRLIKTHEDYSRLFSKAGKEHLAVGEASVWYLYSSTAARNIYHFDKNARIIVMLRNPVDLVHSLHSQLLYSFYEDEPDFGKAWSLQPVRREGLSIPKYCREPAFLQYGEVGSLGHQLEHLFEVFPKDQVKAVLFDDLAASTQTIYCDILAFLGMPPDGKKEFPPVNRNKIRRIDWIGRLHQRLPFRLIHIEYVVNKWFGTQLGILEMIRALNARRISRNPLPEDYRSELRDYFQEDIRKLSIILHRDLVHWLD